VSGAILLAVQGQVDAQTPVVRSDRDGRAVMEFNSQQPTEPDRFPLQQVQHVPELRQVSSEGQFGSGYVQQPSQPAFNIQPVQQPQQVQLAAQRRGFFDRLFPWARRDGVSSDYEQPIEPPNQYQSNPLPANSETEYGPAMSGFNQHYQRPAQTYTPPRTAQGGTPSTNPPTLRPAPAPTPTTPPQASGTTTTNDGRELPVFQFGGTPRSTGERFVPPPAPRLEPSATITPTTPGGTSPGPMVTPVTPMPPIMPLQSPSAGSPPVSESAATEHVDPPVFEDPFLPDNAGNGPALPAPSAGSNGNTGATAFPPPPSNTSVSQAPALNPLPEESTPPAFVPPGAPRVNIGEQSTPSASTGPQLSIASPQLTSPGAAAVPPAFTAEEQAQESNDDKLERIRERRGQTGLKGFCPVMLRDHRELVDAREEFSIEFNGHTYCVSSAEALATFQSDPAKYAPAAGGSDVIHRDLTGEDLPGSLDHAVWYRGRLYMFATAETMETFVAAPSAHRTDL
jgi:YHS domain-containing protein